MGPARLAHAGGSTIHVHVRAFPRGYGHAVEAHAAREEIMAQHLQGAGRVSMVGQCLIQDKISTSPSPTDRRAVIAYGRHIGRYFLLNNIAITNNSTFPKIKLHYSISYCNKTKSNNLI